MSGYNSNMGCKMGRGPATAGVFSALGLLAVAGCADPGTADYAALCATKRPPVIRVDDALCPPLGEEDSSNPHGWFYQQLPSAVYDEDGYGYFPGVAVVSVGSPIPVSSGSAIRPATFDVARTLRPPAVASAGSVVTRGGLGVSSVGSSSGS